MKRQHEAKNSSLWRGVLESHTDASSGTRYGITLSSFTKVGNAAGGGVGGHCRNWRTIH